MAGTEDAKGVPLCYSRDAHAVHTPKEFAEIVLTMQPGERFTYYTTQHSIAIDRERRGTKGTEEGGPNSLTAHAVALAKLAASVMGHVRYGDGLTVQAKRMTRDSRGLPVEHTDYVFVRRFGDKKGKLHADRQD